MIHDEIDLRPGKLRVKRGGGSAGHNGLRSIDALIGPDYWRVRIGVGHPGVKELVQPYVLQNFPAEEMSDWVDAADRRGGRDVPLLLSGAPDAFMSEVARRLAAARSTPAAAPPRARKPMGFNCGIVGLPNVGKSTLFNALTATAAAEAANYPFCTIEPNVGRVAVPDERLAVCARLAKSAKIIPTQLEFVDIAGLVRGAAHGEGLGNQFLGHIREVDAIAHVLRCFDDGNVTHVEGSVDPIRDAETVETELMLADLESLERRVVAVQKRARGGDKEAKALLAVIEPVLAALRDGEPARSRRSRRRAASRSSARCSC